MITPNQNEHVEELEDHVIGKEFKMIMCSFSPNQVRT
jgi:hypothetical protein